MTTLILTALGYFGVGLLAFIIGWKVHPWTVGAATQWVQSPMQQFGTRMGTSIGCVVVAIMGMVKVFPNFGTNALKELESRSSMTNNQNANYYEELPTKNPEVISSVANDTAPKIPDITTPSELPTTQKPNVEEKSAVIPTVIKTSEQPKPKEVVTERPKVSAEPSSAMKIAELKGELAVIETKILSERTRWQGGIDTINRLTNFKRTPVREGSPQYHQCMEASRIIKEVESGAAALKAEKARLSAMIESLEN